jgi:hypothetical protein
MRAMNYAFMGLMLVIWFFIVTGCAGQVYPHGDIMNQILRMRNGYSGLTHRVCAEKNWLGDCKKWDIIEYQIRNKEGRMRFIDLGFVCSVGGRRYKLNPDLPEFVRYQTKTCFLCTPQTVIVERLDYTKPQKFIDAGTFCYSERVYPDGIDF